MLTDFKVAQRIAQDVELRSVTLHSAEMSSHVDPAVDLPSDLEVKQAHRARYEVRPAAPDNLYVFVDLKFSTNLRPDDSQMGGSTLFSLDATFLLLYTLLGAGEREKTDLEYFARLNGTYNVWPYWRELVQTVSGRVGLATVVVPVLRLTPTQIEEPTPEPGAKSSASKAPARAPRKRPAERQST
jgi:hypothetical protein